MINKKTNYKEKLIARIKIKSRKWCIAGTSLITATDAMEIIYSIFYPMPLNYDDLEVNMWVWFEPLKEVVKIEKIYVNKDGKEMVFFNNSEVEFIKGTVFPVIVPEVRK